MNLRLWKLKICYESSLWCCESFSRAFHSLLRLKRSLSWKICCQPTLRILKNNFNFCPPSDNNMFARKCSMINAHVFIHVVERKKRALKYDNNCSAQQLSSQNIVLRAPKETLPKHWTNERVRGFTRKATDITVFKMKWCWKLLSGIITVELRRTQTQETRQVTGWEFKKLMTSAKEVKLRKVRLAGTF